MSTTKREMTVSEALQALVLESNVSVEQVAEDVFDGKSASLVYKMLSPTDPKSDVPTGKLARLIKRINRDRASPDFRPMEILCKELDLVCLPIPKEIIPFDKAITAHAAEILKETGDVLTGLAEAMRPDSPQGADISPGEALDNRQEIWEAMRSLAGLYEVMDPEKIKLKNLEKRRVRQLRASRSP